jgi:hypothetical protein
MINTQNNAERDDGVLEKYYPTLANAITAYLKEKSEAHGNPVVSAVRHKVREVGIDALTEPEGKSKVLSEIAKENRLRPIAKALLEPLRKNPGMPPDFYETLFEIVAEKLGSRDEIQFLQYMVIGLLTDTQK